jgi:hypothetical protein
MMVVVLLPLLFCLSSFVVSMVISLALLLQLLRMLLLQAAEHEAVNAA